MSDGVFEEHRDPLIGVAYRILGRVTDDEDAVQETLLRWTGVDSSEVSNPRAVFVLREAFGMPYSEITGILGRGEVAARQLARRARAPLNPVYGADKVVRFLVAVGYEPSGEVVARAVQVNGGPGVVITAGGEPISVLILDVAGGKVRTVHLVANPEKLAGVREPDEP